METQTTNQIPQATKNNLAVPIAIVIAGLLIALAVFFNGREARQKEEAKVMNAQPTANITVVPVDAQNDHIIGNPKADISLIEYSDTECPFCRIFHATLQNVIKDYGNDGKVSWVYRNMPLDSLHKKARPEAEAAECAYKLGGHPAFWKFIDTIFATTGSNDSFNQKLLPEIAVQAGVSKDAFNLCVASGETKAKVEKQYQDGLKAGGQGTPHTVVVSKNKISDSQKLAISKLFANVRPENNPLIWTQTDTMFILSGSLSAEYLKNIITILTK